MPAISNLSWLSIREDVLQDVVGKIQSHIIKRETALFSYELSRPGNVIFLAVFAIIFGFNLVSAFRSRQIYYSVCFILGFGLETIGFLGRALAFNNPSSLGTYIMQSFCLTIAPAFIMAGIYFMFAQVVMIHGCQYSVLKPMWYSYIFISSDVFSILVQGSGGGLSAMSSSSKSMSSMGDTVMFIGILIQIIAMTLFLIFWFLFLGRTYFHDRFSVFGQWQYKQRGFFNYIKMLLNLPSAKHYKQVCLEPYYNSSYQQIRQKPMFHYYPLAISLAVILVYIRCIYRVAELKMGFNGYLMQHEIYLFVLDSALIAVTGLIFLPFHPMFVFGRRNVITSKEIKQYQKSMKSDAASFSSIGDKENAMFFAAQNREVHKPRTQL